MAVCGQLLLLATTITMVLQSRPEALSPWAMGHVCEAPVAVATRFGLLLDCADSPQLRPCRAQAFDLVTLAPHAKCDRQPNGLPQSWRHGLGLPVDINLATADALQQIETLGPGAARAILARRTQLGRFTSVDDLVTVPGIGHKKLAAWRAHLCCTP